MGCPSHTRVRVDAAELAGREAGARGLGDAAEVEAMGATGVERLGDRERPVPEVVLGREQLDVDQLADERAQCQHRL